MLTPEQWEQISNEATNLYSDLELEIIEEIAIRIASVGYANTVVKNDVIIAQEMGLLYSDIVELVASYNNTSSSKIYKIFEEAGITSINYDDLIYVAAGLNPTLITQSASMLQIIEATARNTNYNLSNLVMTTATASQTQFYNIMNKCYLEVSTGVKSYSQSILDAIKFLSQEGSYVIYPSGARRSIESAVRTNILTSSSQMCGELQLMRAEEMRM